MNYINPNKNENGSYPNLQSNPAEGLLQFGDEFLPEFFKDGKEVAGFVIIEHDGVKVTSCVWNEEAYQVYMENLPDPIPEPEPEEVLSVWDELDAAYQEGVDSV